MIFLPTLLSTVGGGVSLAGQVAGAFQSRSIAETNYKIDAHNATVRRENTLADIAINDLRLDSALDTARVNFQLSQSEATARTQNAERLRKFAEARTAQGRERIRRQVRRFDQFQARQEVAVASAGVAFEGSPIDVMIDTAGQMQLTLQDMANEVQYERDETLQRANLEEFQAGQSMISAQSSLNAAESDFRVGKAMNRIGALSADATYTANMFGAQMDRLNSYQQSNAQFVSAAAGIFTGAAGYIGKQHTINYQGMR